MPPSPPPQGLVRPSAVVNAEIRALVRACGGWLYGEARDRYALLVAEWTVATAAERRRVEVVKAA
ncbi:hypothetical protein [Streptomyces capitiformicae]|uniref:hypothetical protein n=1 Tax=Streptomyces capitiformicae TaxID=2014920 RepID=UPI00167B0489|nr:hypothetical protein [Streptomyces capitiformicae]